jgi:hypothetical protein
MTAAEVAIVVRPEFQLDETSIVKLFQFDTTEMEKAKARFAVVDASTKDGYKEAITGRAVFRDARLSIDKKRKQLNEDATAYTKRVNSVAKQLTALVTPTEDALDAKIKAVDEAKESAKRAAKEAEEAAEKECLRLVEEAERERIRKDAEAEREAIAKEREALEALRREDAERRAREDAERQARLEAEEKARECRERDEKARVAAHARRMTLLQRLAATKLPGTEFEAASDYYATCELTVLESTVATCELKAKEHNEFLQRQFEAEQSQREADERAKAEALAAEEKRLADERAALDARAAVIEANERAERERRFLLLIMLVNAKPEYAPTAFWPIAATRNNIEATDEISEPYASMPMVKLEGLVADAQQLRAERARIEAEEKAVREQERQVELAKRLEALKPDCEKLRVLSHNIRNVALPEFNEADPEVWLTVNTAIDALNNIADILDESADQLERTGSRSHAN